MTKINFKKITLSAIAIGALSLTLGANSYAAQEQSNSTVQAQICQFGPNDPEISLLSPAGNAAVTSQNTNLQFDIDWGNEISVTLNGSLLVSNQSLAYQENLTFDQNVNLNPANNTVEVSLTGGCPESTINRSFTVNYDDSMVSVNKLSTNSSSPELTGAVSNTSANVTVYINGNSFSATNNGDGSWTLPAGTIEPDLADGVYDVRVVTTDPATGNQLVDRSFDDILTIDSTPPAATIKTDSAKNRSPEVTGTVDDPNASVTVEINGKTYNATNNGDGTWTIPEGTIKPELTNGEYLVIAHAIDISGNETIIQQLLVVKADRQIAFVLPPNTGYFRINHTNIPTWTVYLAVIAIISSLVVRKQLSKKQ